jgi:hypothetical protein
MIYKPLIMHRIDDALDAANPELSHASMLSEESSFTQKTVIKRAEFCA